MISSELPSYPPAVTQGETCTTTRDTVTVSLFLAFSIFILAAHLTFESIKPRVRRLIAIDFFGNTNWSKMQTTEKVKSVSKIALNAFFGSMAFMIGIVSAITAYHLHVNCDSIKTLTE